MSRIEQALHKPTRISTIGNLTEASTDKLRCIAEGLLEVLLTVEAVPEIDEDMCEKLFQGLCVSQRSRVQFLAAVLLDRSCRKRPFWGPFLANTLYEMFSSSYTIKFPQDRVFVLLAFLVRRCNERSSVFDATLNVISKSLLPLTEEAPSLLAVSVDLPLLGWLLLFLSLQLDLGKGILKHATRWDWVTGEMGPKTNNEETTRKNKKKTHKTFLSSKKVMDNLDFVPQSTPVKNAVVRIVFSFVKVTSWCLFFV